MLPDVSLLNFPRPAEVPVRGGSVGHGGHGQGRGSGRDRDRTGTGQGQDGDRAGRGPGRAARWGRRRSRGCSGPLPGQGSGARGLRRGRGHRDRAPRAPRSSGRSHPEPAPMRGWDRSHPAPLRFPGGQPRAPFPFLPLLDFPEPHLLRAPSPGLLNFSPRPPQRSLLSSTRSLFFINYLFIFPRLRLSLPHGRSGKARLNPELGFPTWCLAELLSQPRRALTGHRSFSPALPGRHKVMNVCNQTVFSGHLTKPQTCAEKFARLVIRLLLFNSTWTECTNKGELVLLPLPGCLLKGWMLVSN